MGFFNRIKDKWEDFKDDMERDYDTKNGSEAVGAAIGGIIGGMGGILADTAKAGAELVSGDKDKATETFDNIEIGKKASDVGAHIGKKATGAAKFIGGVIIASEVQDKWKANKPSNNKS